MNRRNFLTKLGFGTAAVAATAAVPAIATKEQKLEDGSLRPMCPACRTRMLVRHGEGRPYAFCPLNTCERFGMAIAIRPMEGVAVPHMNDCPAVSQKLIDSYNEQVPSLVEYTEKKNRRYRKARQS
jgi:hypothetical protein